MRFDMSPYDPAEVAMLEARPRCHGTRMRFAIHVEKTCPTHVWPYAFFARWAADQTERLYYLNLAIKAGEAQLRAEASGTAVRRRDKDEGRILRQALFDYAAVSASFGFLDTAGRAVARLLELDPRDIMGAEIMARQRGIFPDAASEKASELRM